MVNVDVLVVVDWGGLFVIVVVDVVDLRRVLLVDEVGVGAGGSHCGV
jgi:hypothetical protein